MRLFLVTHLILSTLLIAGGCSGVQNKQVSGENKPLSTDPQSSSETQPETETVNQEEQKTPSGEPAYITVQHCLISFQGGGVPGVSRSKFDAEQLANELFEKAKAGEDFDEIIKKHTDDSPPGIYRMANDGFADDMRSQENPTYRRRGMVPAFGDVGFTLAVGEYGLASHDPQTSPYGWHIIKRIK